ncbi:putative transcriptional repressor of cell division inhibition protein [Escherichia coli]|uniref:Putative transcriptional repressor of cell division inhibition protein n=1 Tax=Escherichia coli TaxID=562 RepID=A0A376KQ09_ECOLX|nr:putative transcriptional repressor of cell division inhibition protein [Escherichia coli]
MNTKLKLCQSSPLSMGHRILSRRKELGLSQLKLAQAMGVSMAAVSLWEKGKTSITSDKLLKLSELLQCDVQWLLNGNTEKSKYTLTRENGETLFDSMSNKLIRGIIESIDPTIIEDTSYLFEIFANLPTKERVKVLDFAKNLLEEHSKNILLITQKLNQKD